MPFVRENQSGYRRVIEFRKKFARYRVNGYARVLAPIREDDIDLDGDVRQSSKILPSPLTIPH